MSQTSGLAYQIISDQRAKVFNLLSTWIKALLSMTNCVNGSSRQHTLLSPPQILETRTSDVRKDRSFGIGSRYWAIGHEIVYTLYIQQGRRQLLITGCGGGGLI